MVTMTTQMYSNVFFYHIYVPYHNINFSLTWCSLKDEHVEGINLVLFNLRQTSTGELFRIIS